MEGSYVVGREESVVTTSLFLEPLHLVRVGIRVDAGTGKKKTKRNARCKHP